MARSTDLRRPLVALLASAAALAGAAQAWGQSSGALVPSVSADTNFSPPTGLSDFDFSPGTSVDAAGGVAVDAGLGRIYTVGETRINSTDPAIGITARRLDGTLDPGFSEDGKLTINLAEGTQRDAGYAIAVLPGGALRVLATTDVDPGSTSAQTNLNVALVAVNPDGTLDLSWGGGDAWIHFPAGSGNDVPARMEIDPATGRFAITGCAIAGVSGTSCGSGKDSFVAVRNADGSAPGPAVAGGFDAEGVRVIDRGGTKPKSESDPTPVALNDRGIDVAWRPGGGLVALLQVETNPADNDNDWHSVLRGLAEDGTDLPAFSEDADLDLPIGDPDVVPGGLLVHDGRLWVSGAVRSGDNGEAYLARLDPDGSNLQFRTWDVRGGVVPAETPVGSQGNDLVVVPGTPESLIVGGFTTLAEGTAWSASVFQGFTGDLAAARLGERIFAMPRNSSGYDQQGTLVSLAAGGDGWAAAGGSLLDLSSADTSYGTARLLVDAEKRCDLTVEVPRPLEIAFDAMRPAAIDVKVTNAGTKVCAGAVEVPAPYTLSHEGSPAPLSTGLLGPGESRTFSGAQIAYAGERKRADVVNFKVVSAADTNSANDTRAVRALFRYCDLRLRHDGKRGRIPSEGWRRLDFSLRNLGTVKCRDAGVAVSGAGKRRGKSDPFPVSSGHSASESVKVSVAKGATSPAAVTFSAVGTDDVDPANDALTLTFPVVGVGDSAVRRATRRAVRGTATPGTSGASSKKLALKRVQVSVRRKAGRKCSWLTRKGTQRKRSCRRPVWLKAKGTRAWRLRFAHALPNGTYEVRSRAVIRAGFPEARFSKGDGNLRRLRVR